MLINGQFRIEKVQVLNWGGYSDLQVMHVERAGTAILGPSGRGKSTLLDAMASVILPNPQEFNQAARDDKGQKRERTVYTYARGLTDRRRDENRRSGTTTYVRPPGTNGFASGAAITWAHDDGRRVTVFRLAWVASDTTGADAINANTIYGFVSGDFDLDRLNGLTGVRSGASPLTKTTLSGLIDTSRGDLVDSSQSKIHAKMRSVMEMGKSDESQRLAMHLLRRAQASKGIFNINALFKEFVLTEPLALDRWGTALEAYREASRLYDEYEATRRKLETLTRLPQLAERYRYAGEDHTRKTSLLLERAEGTPARLRIWHAHKLLDWLHARIDDNRLRTAETNEDLQAANARRTHAKTTFDNLLLSLTAAGGDKAPLLKVQLDTAQQDLDRIGIHRAAVSHRLSEFDHTLPASQGDLLLLQDDLSDMLTRLETQLIALDAEAKAAVLRAGMIAGQLKSVAHELHQLGSRRSNISPEAAQLRADIAAATDVPLDRLHFFGELIQIKAEHQSWEAAVFSVLRGVAKDLVVDQEHFIAVRRFINDYDTRMHVSLVPVREQGSEREPVPGTVPAILELADSPFAPWVLNELVDRFSHQLVERDSDLDTKRASHLNGAVTRAGMRTAAFGRFVKDDSVQRYSFIGWDTADLRRDLEQNLASLSAELAPADAASNAAQATRDDARDRARRLTALRAELDWASIDTAPAADRVRQLQEEIAEANTPEVAELQKQLDDARTEMTESELHAREIETNLTTLTTSWGVLVDLEDESSLLIDDSSGLDSDEREATGTLGFLAPPVDVTTATPRAVRAAIEASYGQAASDLQNQLVSLRKEREALETAVLATIRAFRGLDDRNQREIDESIDSLPALLSIHDQLLTDDLPRTKQRWLEQVDQDMNTQLRGLLVQIDDDRRSIVRGLAPIDSVLERVPFRLDSTLTIDVSDKPSGELNEFRSTISEYTSNTLHQSIERDAEKIERDFNRLRRKLALLDDLTRTGESWRRRVFDAREHVEFKAIEKRADGVEIVHDGVSGMSGGEGQELIAFILGAALRYRLGEGTDAPPTYASIVLDEGFVKADSDYTGRALAALSALGFQLIIGAPREKATAFEYHVETVAYINSDPANPHGVRIFEMTISEALSIEEAA